MGFENSIIKFNFYEIINKNNNTKNLENILGPGFIWAHGQNVSDKSTCRDLKIVLFGFV